VGVVFIPNAVVIAADWRNLFLTFAADICALPKQNGQTSSFHCIEKVPLCKIGLSRQKMSFCSRIIVVVCHCRDLAQSLSTFPADICALPKQNVRTKSLIAFKKCKRKFGSAKNGFVSAENKFQNIWHCLC
jgi:hypothetical protein